MVKHNFKFSCGFVLPHHGLTSFHVVDQKTCVMSSVPLRCSGAY